MGANFAEAFSTNLEWCRVNKGWRALSRASHESCAFISRSTWLRLLCEQCRSFAKNSRIRPLISMSKGYSFRTSCRTMKISLCAVSNDFLLYLSDNNSDSFDYGLTVEIEFFRQSIYFSASCSSCWHYVRCKKELKFFFNLKGHASLFRFFVVDSVSRTCLKQTAFGGSKFPNLIRLPFKHRSGWKAINSCSVCFSFYLGIIFQRASYVWPRRQRWRWSSKRRVFLQICRYLLAWRRRSRHGLLSQQRCSKATGDVNTLFQRSGREGFGHFFTIYFFWKVSKGRLDHCSFVYWCICE